MNEFNFSLYPNIWQTETDDVIAFNQLGHIISSNIMKEQIQVVRNCVDEGQKKKYKCHLPNITVNGVFAHRDNSDIITYNQITALDIDHIPDYDMENTKTQLINNPLTFFMFLSPSGNGYKILVKHDNTDSHQHWNMYAQLIKEYYSIPYLDKQVNDLSRATFLSYDADYYYNPSANTFHYEYSPVVQSASMPNQIPNRTFNHKSPMTTAMTMMNGMFQTTWKDKALMDYIDKYQWRYYPEDYQKGHRNESIIKKATQLCLCGVHYETALWKLNYLYSRDSANAVAEYEIERRVHYAYINNLHNFGRERQKWIDIKKQRMAGK